MKKLGTIVLFLGMQLLLSGQPDMQWHKTYGGNKVDEAMDVLPTQDGGSIVVSHSSSTDGDVLGNHGQIDYWVLKLDSVGNIEWNKLFGGSYIDWPYGIINSTDGGYLIAGVTQSSNGDVTNFKGDRDGWLVKISSKGDLIWEKTIGGSEWDEFRSIDVDSDGNYLLTGTSNSVDGDLVGVTKGYLDLWVVKIDGTGNIIWQNRVGGITEDIGWDIQFTSDKGAIVVGETLSADGDVVGHNGNNDFWVLKFDSTGTLEWQNSLGGSGSDRGFSVKEVEGSFIACGFAGSNDGDVTKHQGAYDFWIIKLDEQGNLLWQKTYGGSDADNAYELLIQGKDILVTGITRSHNGDVVGNLGIQVVWLLRLNENGDLIWKKAMGGTKGEASLAVSEMTDNGLMVVGSAWSENGDLAGVTNLGMSDLWVIKLFPESTTTTQAPTLHLELFPNPATHTVFLNTPQYEESLQAIVTDLSGRELYRQKVNSFDGLEVSSLSKGLYLVEAIGEGGVRYVGKLLKQ